MSLLGNIPPEDLGPGRDLRRGRDDRDIDLDSLPRCPNCDYIIFKVGRMRCPECGVPLGHTDLAPSQARLAADEQYRDERRVLRIGLGLGVAGAALTGYSSWRLWPLSACLLATLVVSTAMSALWCMVFGGAAHRTAVLLGSAWLLVGVVLTLMLVL